MEITIKQQKIIIYQFNQILQFWIQQKLSYNFQSSQIVMRPTHRVERNAAFPFLQTYTSTLGIASVDSYLYVFYPNTIRVYEQFPQKAHPELSEELIISHRKINKFAVSKQFIAMLFQDSKIEVRLRQYWQVVQYSLTLQQQVKSINLLTIKGQKIIYRYFDERKNKNIYGFISLKLNQQNLQSKSKSEIQYLSPQYQFDQLIHLKQLGGINYFYVGLMKNQIKFGMYYNPNPQNAQYLKQFEFGCIKQQDPSLKILAISMKTSCRLEYTQNSSAIMSHSNNIYLIQLILKQNKGNQKNKILMKCKKFYNQLINQPKQQNKQLDEESKKIINYTKMLHTLQQIQINTNYIKNQQKITKQHPINSSKIKNQKSQINIQTSHQQIIQTQQIQLQPQEQYINSIQHENKLYFATNKRIFWLQIVQFVNKSQNKIKLNCKYTQVYRLQQNSRLIQICKDVIYITGQSCYTVCINNVNNVKKQESFSNKQKLNKQTNNVSNNNLNKVVNSSLKEESTIKQMKVEKKNQQMQTEVDSDVLLDQYGQKQMKNILDYLLEKKKVNDAQTQTQVQICSSQSQANTKQEKIQQKQTKSYNQVCIGQNIPICPRSHEQSLEKINKNFGQYQSKMHKQTLLKINQSLKKQYQKIKVQIIKKIEKIVQSAVNNTVVPLIQPNIRSILQTKLQQVNVYIYTLSMQHLLHMKQEIQKDQVKQNMLRTELIKKQLHQITEGKKAVAQMIEICKKRQMQKIVFFQEMKNKFSDIEKKVLYLQTKMKGLIQGEQASQLKIFDQIQVIKTMLKNQDPVIQQIRKKSMLSLHSQDIVEQSQSKNQSQEQEEDQNQQEQQQQQQSAQEQSQEQEQYEQQQSIYPRRIAPPPHYYPYHTSNYPPSPYSQPPYPMYQGYPMHPPPVSQHYPLPFQTQYNPYEYYQRPKYTLQSKMKGSNIEPYPMIKVSKEKKKKPTKRN